MRRGEVLSTLCVFVVYFIVFVFFGFYFVLFCEIEPSSVDQAGLELETILLLQITAC